MLTTSPPPTLVSRGKHPSKQARPPRMGSGLAAQRILHKAPLAPASALVLTYSSRPSGSGRFHLVN